MHAPCNSAGISRPQDEDLLSSYAMCWQGFACKCRLKKQWPQQPCTLMDWQQLAALLRASQRTCALLHEVHLEWPQRAYHVCPFLKQLSCNIHELTKQLEAGEQGWHPVVQRLLAGLVQAALARAQGPEVCGGLGRLPLKREVH